MGHLHYSQVKARIKENHSGIEEHENCLYRVTKKITDVSGTDREPGWYFIDETWSDLVGPYETKELCKEGLMKYAIHLEGGSS